MADKRITELQPLEAAAVLGSVDVLAVADVSAAETMKIKVGDLVAAGLAGGVPDGSIPGSKIEEDTITSKELLRTVLLMSSLLIMQLIQLLSKAKLLLRKSLLTVQLGLISLLMMLSRRTSLRMALLEQRRLRTAAFLRSSLSRTR